MLNAPYSIIYADPAWHYNSRCQHSKTRFGGGAVSQYPLMSDEDLLALPVGKIAADDAVLFMWATGPRLDFAIDVIRAWKFEFKTVGFTWMKLNKRGKGLFFGTGFYAKSNAEFCLLAARGETLTPATNKVSSAILEPVGRHSAKPRVARERIEMMYPRGRKIELFARQRVDGWDAIGFDLDGSDIRLVLERELYPLLPAAAEEMPVINREAELQIPLFQ